MKTQVLLSLAVAIVVLGFVPGPGSVWSSPPANNAYIYDTGLDATDDVDIQVYSLLPDGRSCLGIHVVSNPDAQMTLSLTSRSATASSGDIIYLAGETPEPVWGDFSQFTVDKTTTQQVTLVIYY